MIIKHNGSPFIPNVSECMGGEGGVDNAGVIVLEDLWSS